MDGEGTAEGAQGAATRQSHVILPGPSFSAQGIRSPLPHTWKGRKSSWRQAGFEQCVPRSMRGFSPPDAMTSAIRTEEHGENDYHAGDAEAGKNTAAIEITQARPRAREVRSEVRRDERSERMVKGERDRSQK